MWTSENRPKYNRDKLRYPSDLTDDEWSHIEPLIPPAKRGGRKRAVDPREIVNGVMYVLSTGCQWRYVPKDLPPKSTLFGYFDLWNWDGTLDRIHHALRQRRVQPRRATPSASSGEPAHRRGLQGARVQAFQSPTTLRQVRLTPRPEPTEGARRA